MRSTRYLSVSWMPFALEHAMTSICRAQLLSGSSIQCYSSACSHPGLWRPHIARCWLASKRAPPGLGLSQQPLQCRPRHQQRHMKKHASASTLMLEQEQKFKEDQRRELTSVNTALAANSLIFVAKSAAWFVCGGSSLLAEAIHSLADIGNQAMLRVGITYAAQAPTAQYPFGHMRDKFIFSLISAVGIFCLGAGVSIVHGLHAIASPAAHADNMWGIAALIFSTVVEGATLLVAVRAVAAGARSAGFGFLEYIKSGRDPVSVAIMAEDGAAVAGVIVAAACTMLADYTGMLMWDGIGSILVGLILGGVAVYLIQRNRSFLIGRSMNPGDFKKIVRHIKQDPVVKNVYEAKSEEIGEGIFRVSAEVDFHGPNLLERYMKTKDVQHMRHQFSHAVQGPNTQEFENIMKAYGTEVVGLVGAQIDRIEAEVMQLVPGVMYVDLETDRGRFSSYSKATQSFDEVEDLRLETFRGNRPKSRPSSNSQASATEQNMMKSVLVGDLDTARNGANGAAAQQPSSANHPTTSDNSNGKTEHSDMEAETSMSTGESLNGVQDSSKSGTGIGGGGKS